MSFFVVHTDNSGYEHVEMITREDFDVNKAASFYSDCIYFEAELVILEDRPLSKEEQAERRRKINQQRREQLGL